MRWIKKCQNFRFFKLLCLFVVHCLFLSLKIMSWLKQLGRKLYRWSTSILGFNEENKVCRLTSWFSPLCIFTGGTSSNLSIIVLQQLVALQTFFLELSGHLCTRLHNRKIPLLQLPLSLSPHLTRQLSYVIIYLFNCAATISIKQGHCNNGYSSLELFEIQIKPQKLKIL